MPERSRLILRPGQAIRVDDTEFRNTSNSDVSLDGPPEGVPVAPNSDRTMQSLLHFVSAGIISPSYALEAMGLRDDMMDSLSFALQNLPGLRKPFPFTGIEELDFRIHRVVGSGGVNSAAVSASVRVIFQWVREKIQWRLQHAFHAAEGGDTRNLMREVRNVLEELEKMKGPEGG